MSNPRSGYSRDATAIVIAILVVTRGVLHLQADDPDRTSVQEVSGDSAEYVDAIPQLLAAMPEILYESKPPLPNPLSSMIASNQPGSGDLLLKLIADRTNDLHRPATNAFVLSWETMTTEQIDRYVQSTVVARVYNREHYPRGVDALAEFRYSTWDYGWGAWPDPDTFPFETRTTHFIDGQPYGEPFSYEYSGPGATTGWARTADLSLGRHTASLVVDYEFSHRRETRKGTIRSAEAAFEVVSADMPDDLVAASDPEIDQAVQSVLKFAEIEEDFQKDDSQTDVILALDAAPHERQLDPWRAQTSWTWRDGRAGGGLHVPLWKLDAPLPVDLCFEVEIRVVETEELVVGDPLIVHKGQTSQGYFFPRSSPAFARARSGFVRVEVTLRPSRRLALTDPEITNYYSNVIRTSVLRMKVAE